MRLSEMTMPRNSIRSLVGPFCIAVVLVLAGCNTGTYGGDTTSNPTPERSPESELTTPTPSTTDCPGCPRFTPKPLPEQPNNLTRESAVRFAKDYEQAYKWNHEVTNTTTEVTINPVRAGARNETETGYVVHLEIGFSHTLQRDGDEMTGGGYYTVNYFINGTTIMRAHTGGQARPGPNPRNGTVIEG